MQLSKLYEKYEKLLLVILFTTGFLVRLHGFTNPIADWHSWRQADTSAVSRDFVKNGFDILHPRFDDLSNVPSGLDNPQGYRFVEFPIYNVLQAGLYNVAGILTLEEWGRMVTIIMSLFSALFIYLLISKRFGKLSGYLSSFFFLLLPYNIYYSRTILPDPSMVMTILGGTYFFSKWIDKEKFYYLILSIIFTLSSFLLKPYALIFTLPMVYMSFEKYKLGVFKKWQLWVFAILSVLPLVWWRTWITQFPQGVPQSDWLFNGNGIRFRPSFFYWIFWKRIIELILGYFGLPILVLSFLNKFTRKDLLFVLSFVLSSLLYVSIIATGNVQHDYYQILIIPTIAILLGLGGNYLLNLGKGSLNKMSVGLFVFLTVLSFAFGWNQVKDYFNINNHSIVIAGEYADKNLPKDAKILANYNGDTSFLYQTNRKGWASFEKGLPEMAALGANYLILVNPTSQDLELGKLYKVVKHSPEFVIFNLNKPL